MENHIEKPPDQENATPDRHADRGVNSPPPIPDTDVQPASFPRGFWPSIDYLLHHPEEVVESLKGDVGLWRLTRIFLAISLFMAALYGAVMGATNLLQGSSMPIGFKFLTILVTAVKVPALYLVTLVIVLPPIYVSNAFIGARLTIRQMIASIMGAMAVTVTVLGSMATIAAFFALTSRSYNFIKVLHVTIFAYAGLSGLGYLVRSIRAMLPGGRKRIPNGLFVLWLVLYMFVGTQMAWVLRPFVGSPGMEFRLFRPRTGNFYESVLDSIGDLFRMD